MKDDLSDMRRVTVLGGKGLKMKTPGGNCYFQLTVQQVAGRHANYKISADMNVTS